MEKEDDNDRGERVPWVAITAALVAAALTITAILVAKATDAANNVVLQKLRHSIPLHRNMIRLHTPGGRCCVRRRTQPHPAARDTGHRDTERSDGGYSTLAAAITVPVSLLLLMGIIQFILHSTAATPLKQPPQVNKQAKPFRGRSHRSC